MRSSLVVRAILCAVALLAGTAGSRAGEREDRDRKARAALALSAPAAPTVPTAPAPRAATPSYAEAYARAVEEGSVLVVFVECDPHPVAGAVVCRSKDALMPGAPKPGVVVGYPVGDRLIWDVSLKGCPTGREIERAVGTARGKRDKQPAKSVPMPVPGKRIDWYVRAETAPRTELDHLRDASVRVWCGNAGGSGTVVFAEPGRSVVLTAWHVVSGEGPLTVRADGRTLPARVLLSDRAADVAALEVRRELSAVAPVGDAVRAGDPVLLVGGSSIWSRGRASEVATVSDRPCLLADYESASGDSGGGVFAGGELVGVHLGRLDASARCAVRLTDFVAQAIRAEPAHASEPKGEPKLKALPAELPAAGCAGGNCPLPGYQPARGGLFRRR